nr:integumentary mucin C.1-like [Penaeus vannamei]
MHVSQSRLLEIRRTVVHVYVHESVTGLYGLCGTEDSSSDYTDRSGAVVSDLTSFANSWKTEDQTVNPSCSSGRKKRSTSESAQCTLDSTKTDEFTTKCTSTVYSTTYLGNTVDGHAALVLIAACEFDLCMVYLSTSSDAAVDAYLVNDVVPTVQAFIGTFNLSTEAPTTTLTSTISATTTEEATTVPETTTSATVTTSTPQTSTVAATTTTSEPQSTTASATTTTSEPQSTTASATTTTSEPQSTTSDITTSEPQTTTTSEPQSTTSEPQTTTASATTTSEPQTTASDTTTSEPQLPQPLQNLSAYHNHFRT